MDINLERQAGIKRFIHEVISESLVRYVFKQSGYRVLRGAALGRFLRARDNYFRDREQQERIVKCLKICDCSHKVGLPVYEIGMPDYFIYSDADEFFVEVKCNKSKLKESQDRAFPLINEIIPIKIARMNVDFSITSQGIVMYDLSENEKLKSKTVEKIRELLPDLGEDKINKLFDIFNKREEFPFDLLDLRVGKAEDDEEELVDMEQDKPVENEEDEYL